MFYNKIQEFNRDMSVHILNNFVDLLKDEVADRVAAWRQNLAKLPKPGRRSAALQQKQKEDAAENDKMGVAATENKESKTQDQQEVKTGSDLANEYPPNYVPPRFRFRGLRIFEALSASGLRSIRYWREVKDVLTIHANDLDPAASIAIRENIRFNEVPLDRVIPTQGDAATWMYMNRTNAAEPPYQPFNDGKKGKDKQSAGGEKQKAWKDMTDEEKAAARAERKQREDAAMESILRLPRAFPPVGTNHPAFTPHWNVIDLDPYGSAAPFIDAAVQAIDHGGLLCVTCTDMSILCGNHPETCFVKYAGMSLSNPMCHELGLRILLNTIEISATRYQRHIEPLLSLSIDYYCRVWVRVFDAPNAAKATATRRGFGFVCTGCRTFCTQRSGKLSHNQYFTRPKTGADDQLKYTQGSGPSVDRRCDECGSAYKIVGPMWLDPIHDINFVKRCINTLTSNKSKKSQTKESSPTEVQLDAVEKIMPLANGQFVELHSPDPEYTALEAEKKFGTYQRMLGMLQMCAAELQDVPFYYSPNSMSNVLHCRTPNSLLILSALHTAGYRVSETHCSAGAFKTDAPPSLVWDIMRQYIRTYLTGDARPWTVNDPRVARALRRAQAKHTFAYRFEDFLEKDVFEWTEEQLQLFDQTQSVKGEQSESKEGTAKRVCLDGEAQVATMDGSGEVGSMHEELEHGDEDDESECGQKRKRCPKSQKKDERRLTKKAIQYATSAAQSPDAGQIPTIDADALQLEGVDQPDLKLGIALVEADTIAALKETDPTANSCKAPLLQQLPLLTPPHVVLRSFGAAPGSIIMARKPMYKLDLTEKTYEELGLPRIKMFFANPEKYWGPKARAGPVQRGEVQDDKQNE